MANGQPKPTFYVAVLLVIAGLVGLALWQYGAIRPGGGKSSQITNDELKQMKGGAEAPDSAGITTVKEGARQRRHHDGQGVQIRRGAEAPGGQRDLDV